MSLRYFNLIAISLLSFVISGCSVYKAASNEGVSVSDIKNCRVKGCLLAKGMTLIEEKEFSDGSLIAIYRAPARKTGINYVRAAGHGVMDVMTLGVWEVVGTPVEGAISNNLGFIVAKTIYPNKTAIEFEKIEIYDANGKKVS